MQLMRIRKYKTDIHKLGKKYGNLLKIVRKKLVNLGDDFN